MRYPSRVLVLLIATVSFMGVIALPAAATTKTLNVVMQKQAKTNWCWAAVSSMIANYLGGSTIQPTIVEYTYPGENYPNKSGDIVKANRAINHFESQATGNPTFSSLSFTAVKYQVSNAGPMWATWAWTGGGGHAIAIRGYDDTSPGYVMYVDPIYGVQYKKSYSAFKADSEHTWVESIYYR